MSLLARSWLERVIDPAHSSLKVNENGFDAEFSSTIM